MNIIFHKATEKPKPYTLCLVFFDKLHPQICRYLDDTEQDVKDFGNGEGFYKDNEPMSNGKWENFIGWIELEDLDKLVKETKG